MASTTNLAGRALLTFAAGALLAVIFVPASADAQNVSRGQQLYDQLGCSTSSCHGPNPAQNLRNVLNGAGSAEALEYTATVRAEHNELLTYFSVAPSMVQDLAAYLATIVAEPPPPPPPPPSAPVVEYFHAGFGHYFVTNLAAEISALDAGTFAGWARTGKSFTAYTGTNGLVVAVCRFFTVAFPPKSSHFYTPHAGECEGLRNGSDWQYEGDGFYVDLPDATGACTSATLRPVYRLYNNGQGGAPNHRYTTDPAVRTQMLANGWVSEGVGAQGVIFCVPS